MSAEPRYWPTAKATAVLSPAAAGYLGSLRERIAAHPRLLVPRTGRRATKPVMVRVAKGYLERLEHDAQLVQLLPPEYREQLERVATRRGAALAENRQHGGAR